MMWKVVFYNYLIIFFKKNRAYLKKRRESIHMITVKYRYVLFVPHDPTRARAGLVDAPTLAYSLRTHAQWSRDI
jgi:hypothetical protein